MHVRAAVPAAEWIGAAAIIAITAGDTVVVALISSVVPIVTALVGFAQARRADRRQAEDAEAERERQSRTDDLDILRSVNAGLREENERLRRLLAERE